MKIVVINGQNHQGSTWHIGKMLTDKISGEKQITEYFLPRDLNHFCLGCYQCLSGDSKCPFYTEKSGIMQAIAEADLLVFTTPTYCLRASAAMKALIDLTFTCWMPHRPRGCMFSKRAVVISTAAGSGAKSAIKDITTALVYCGVPWVKTYGVSVQAFGWEGVSAKKKAGIEQDISRLAGKIHCEKAPRVGLKTRALFLMMRLTQMHGMGSDPYEKEYWEEQGWFGKKRPWNHTGED